MDKATSLRQVNKAIQKKFPLVKLVKGSGYYYIASDDDQMQTKIAGLYTSSIPVYALSQQTVEQWVRDVEQLLKNGDSGKNSTIQ